MAKQPNNKSIKWPEDTSAKSFKRLAAAIKRLGSEDNQMGQGELEVFLGCVERGLNQNKKKTNNEIDFQKAAKVNQTLDKIKELKKAMDS